MTDSKNQIWGWALLRKNMPIKYDAAVCVALDNKLNVMHIIVFFVRMYQISNLLINISQMFLIGFKNFLNLLMQIVRRN